MGVAILLTTEFGVLDSVSRVSTDLVKVNTYYEGGAEPQALHDNLSIRSSYYGEPGPASTGMPLPRLNPEGAMISIDAIAALP